MVAQAGEKAVLLRTFPKASLVWGNEFMEELTNILIDGL